jgi:aryl-alcohol dehydrogenase-like predicted oxidoreductase
LGLTVFAHALGLNLGMCLFDDADALSRMRPWWVERWKHPSNGDVVRRVASQAAELGISPRAIMIAWMLNRPYPVIPIVSLLHVRQVSDLPG